MKSVSSKRLYQYWQDLRGDRPAPERRDIEPAAIKSLLSDVFILEHVSGVEFSYRLAGSSLCAAYCRELKSRSFRQYWNEEDLEALDTMMLAIREDAAAAVVGYHAINQRGQRAPFEMLLLPLRYGGKDYPRILGIAAPSDSDYWLGLHPVERHEITAMRLIWPDEQPAFLRHAVNADALMESDFLNDDRPLGDLVEGDFGVAIRDSTVSESRATARRQAFRIIEGGRS
ncbi:MAG: PAS domain-containing protein [Hyphomicrobiales bacterium]